MQVVADPDLELRGVPVLIYLPCWPFSLHSFLVFFFTQNKRGGGGGGGVGPLDLVLADILVQQKTSDRSLMIRSQFCIFSVGLDLACNGSHMWETVIKMS